MAAIAVMARLALTAAPASGGVVGPTPAVENAKESWLWIATTLSSAGYAADLSPVSLWEIDRLFDEQTRRGKARPRGLLSRQLGARLFAIGAYVGEVIRRARGGEWISDARDADAEMNVAVRLTDGTIVWPVQQVMKRFKNGRQEGIAAYGAGLGLEVGPERQYRQPARTGELP